jgi:AcrR family transcriptional regulator
MAGADGTGTPRRDGRTTDTAARIREVALELFVQQGFSRTTLQDIADQLGLTRAALYYHHPSKDHLIASLVQPAKDDIDDFLARARARGLSTREILEGFFDLNFRHRRIFLALLRDPTGLGSVEAEGWVTQLAAQAQRLLAGDAPDTGARIRALVAVSGLSRCATVLPDVAEDELRAASVDLAMEIVEAAD